MSLSHHSVALAAAALLAAGGCDLPAERRSRAALGHGDYDIIPSD